MIAVTRESKRLKGTAILTERFALKLLTVSEPAQTTLRKLLL